MDAGLLLASLADPVVACDAAGLVVYANGPAESVLGWPAQELIGRPVDEIVPARLRTVDGLPFYRYLAARTSALEARTVRGPARRRDGVELEIEFTAAIGRDADGGEVIVASLRPLHEPNAVRLDESFRQVFENAPLGIFHFDHRGVITACNDKFVELIGSSRRQLLGLNMLTLPDVKIAGAVRAAIAGQRGQYEGEYHSVTAHKVTPVRVLFTPIWAGGQVRGGVGIVEDVTEQRRIEAELQRADRMASVGTLAAGVAHEINNPLAYVLSSIELAAQRIDLAREQGGGDQAALDEIAALLDNARDGADRVRVIVRDLKTFSRGAATAERTRVDLEQVLDSAINIAWNEIRYRARLTKEYGAVPPIVGDGPRLGQVFLNLLVNAAQAMPEGKVADNEIRVRTRALGDRVEIEISDTGSGIAPELIGRVFEPFVTGKQTSGGTGLGLWICHNIVTAHDGEITAESPSEGGRGSRFLVRLPARADELAAMTAAPPAPADPRTRRARRRVLIVDDEARLRRTLARELGARHSVVVAASGGEALDLLAEDSAFDLVLCDVMMPDLTGVDVYERLAAAGRPICERFVFMTGGAFTARARAFLDTTTRPQLQKPFGAAEVEALFEPR